MILSTRSRLTKLLGGRVQWLLAGVTLVLAPKCILCWVAYLTAGAALGFGGREVCGATPGSMDHWPLLLTLSIVSLGLIGFTARFRRRRTPVTAEKQPPAR